MHSSDNLAAVPLTTTGHDIEGLLEGARSIVLTLVQYPYLIPVVRGLIYAAEDEIKRLKQEDLMGTPFKGGLVVDDPVFTTLPIPGEPNFVPLKTQTPGSASGV